MEFFTWSVEDIVTAHPDLYLEHCAVMAVALLGRLSEPPCDFLVECEGFCPPDLGVPRFGFGISWSEPTAAKAKLVWSSEQPNPIVERAAVALAALAFAHLIPDGGMRVTRHGERADYWLPQLRCALEISGTQRRRELGRRHRQKVAQVRANPLGWDGYVFVCCFSPTRRGIRWSYHQQSEGDHESA
jgi:hypothetical protein